MTLCKTMKMNFQSRNVYQRWFYFLLKRSIAATDTLLLEIDKKPALDISHINAGPANTHYFPKKQTLALILLVFILLPWDIFSHFFKMW